MEDHFQNAALGVGPIKDGKAVVPAAHAAAVKDAITDIYRFLPLRPALVDRDGEAVLLVRPEALRFAAVVVFDDTVGGLQYPVGGTVILLQSDHVGAGEILLKLQNIADVRTPPAVDALVIVAHHAQVPMLLGKQTHDMVLGHVGVLILVHQNIAEPVPILLQNIRPLLEELDGLQKQIVKVQGVGLLQPLLIEGEGFRHLPRLIALDEVLLRAEGVVFGIGEDARQHALGEHFVV